MALLSRLPPPRPQQWGASVKLGGGVGWGEVEPLEGSGPAPALGKRQVPMLGAEIRRRGDDGTGKHALGPPALSVRPRATCPLRAPTCRRAWLPAAGESADPIHPCAPWVVCLCGSGNPLCASELFLCQLFTFSSFVIHYPQRRQPQAHPSGRRRSLSFYGKFHRPRVGAQDPTPGAGQTSAHFPRPEVSGLRNEDMARAGAGPGSGCAPGDEIGRLLRVPVLLLREPEAVGGKPVSPDL